MIRVLKAGQTVDQKAQDQTSVRDTVTKILSEIEAHGDSARARCAGDARLELRAHHGQGAFTCRTGFALLRA